MFFRGFLGEMVEMFMARLIGSGDSLTLEFDGGLDITGVKDFLALTRPMIESPPHRLAINAQKLEKADTAALQSLAAVVQALRAGGTTITWAGASSVFLNSAKLLGLAGAFQ